MRSVRQRFSGTSLPTASRPSRRDEAVLVLHYNKPSVVILSAVEYARLKRRDKRVVATEDFAGVDGGNGWQYGDGPALLVSRRGGITCPCRPSRRALWCVTNISGTVVPTVPREQTRTIPRVSSQPFVRRTDQRTSCCICPSANVEPSGEEEGIELPDDVRRKTGLDERRQWVLVSECNVDTWPMDLRQVPRREGVFHYGHLPPSMFVKVRDRFMERYRANKVLQVGRPGP